ncbi:flippase [Thermococcus sp. JdF3]|uniref:flippase n=1 Tax=Thermococcus sp. JdF3 TaxID=1638258 RepID=UPI0014389C47|nr:flippase [Thermococcus sp. JdF3]NJE02075.1 flippase [Thermococcus sp. JdF3]
MDEVNHALQRMARGTGIVFFGGIIGVLITFVSRTLVARHFERAQYGTFNLALTLLSIGLIMALLGFPSGLPRELSRYRKEGPERVARLISTSLILILITSLMITVVYLLLAPYISQILNDQYLTRALRLTAPAMPFMALTSIIIAISRGFGRVRENFYYQKILAPSAYLLVVLIVVFGGLDFETLFVGYVLSQALTSMSLLIETLRLGILRLRFSFDATIAKGLVVFSVPLMLTGILDYIMNWTDTLMLGYYFNSDIVGLYNAASPLARFIPVFLGSAGFLFTPIATSFYTEDKMKELKRIYQIITRWIFLPTFPLFLLLVVFPEIMITALFGAKYASSYPALEILAIGFMFHTLLGLNGMSLTVIGEPTSNLIGNVFAATSNVLLNIILIPEYGISGAAIATSVSYIVANLFRSGWLYRRTGIHPFGRSYSLQVGVAILITLALKALAPANVGFITALIVVGASFLCYAAIILLLKTVEPEDIDLVRAIGQKFGWDLGFITRFLERFERL